MSPWFVVMLAVTAAEPVRWLPVIFEQAAWARQSPPELLTDLGGFRWEGSAWAPAPRGASPIVPMLRPSPAAALGDELLLAPGTAALQLADQGRRVFVVRPGLGAPVSVDLPLAEGLPASALRFLADLPDAWLVEGIATSGDSQLGVFLLRLAKASRTSAFVRPLEPGDVLPAFAQALRYDGATWLLPATASESQEIWVWRAGRWERRAPPTAESALLDAFAGPSGLYAAYTNGVAVESAAGRRWHPLSAEMREGAWLCPAPHSAPVRGRWLRGDAVVGWSVGTAEPDPGYPLDGTSCAFFTNAAGAQGLAAPAGVNISLTTPGSLPATR
jgi:hypothetical protein